MTDTGDRLRFAGIADLAHLLRSGAVTPIQLAQQALDLLDSDGRLLNAVVTLTPSLAMAQAHQAERELAAGQDRGPLHGIPYGAKDLLATAGIPTTWGAAPYQHQVFAEDAAVIERLRDAGAVLVAKLAMVELAGGCGYDQPDAAFTGPGRNAWDPDAWAGGSSSGSGSAVAIGAIPFAIGSETWGSITTPSAYNGLTGLRPTYGRVSRRGAMALSWSMDKLGPMAHSAADCAVVLAAIAGHDPADPTSSVRPFVPALDPAAGWRFAVLRGAAESAEPAVRENFMASLDVLAELGTLTEVDLPELPFNAAAQLVIIAEGAAAFEDLIDAGRTSELTAPEDRHGLLDGSVLPTVDYLRALRVRQLGGRALDALLAPFDAIVSPTLRQVASRLTARFSDDDAEDSGPSIDGAGNLCGLPAITVPNGFGERDLPTGLMFTGRAYADATILAAAQAFQTRTTWHARRPPALAPPTLDR